MTVTGRRKHRAGRRRPAERLGATRLPPRVEDGNEVRAIPAYQATKAYRCPGCAGEVLPGTPHLVVVPLDDPDARRHWHRACWALRRRRPPIA